MTEPESSPSRSLFQTVAIFLLLTIGFTLAQVAVHHLRNDPTLRFLPKVDEEQHFMTGLMIHDYLLQDLPHNPIRYAKSYYQHYPQVAFGSWPPLLHMGLALWMLLFPATRASGVLYSDFMLGALAVSAMLAAHRRVPWLIAVAVAIGVWCSPMTQYLDGFVGADLQYSFFSLTCVYLFASYLENPSHSRACWFGAALLASVMTKNNGLFLGISVPLMLVLTRQYDVLRRRNIWLSVVPSIVFVGVWQYVTLPFNIGNLKGVTGESIPGLTLFTFLQQLVGLVWIGLLPFILWSIYARIVRPLLARRPVNILDAATFALLVGPVLFHSMLPHDVNQRYLVPSIAALLLFAGQAMLDLLSLPVFARFPQPLKWVLVAVLLVVCRSPQRYDPGTAGGYAELAQDLLAKYPANQAPAVLISASFGSQAVLIAEVATHESRMGHWLIRGSKIFSHRNGVLNNRQVELTGKSPAEMLSYLQDLPISVLVLADDGDPQHAPEYDLVTRILHDYPDRWTRVLSKYAGAECGNASCTVEVYQLNSAVGQTHFSPGKLPTDMSLWKGL